MRKLTLILCIMLTLSIGSVAFAAEPLYGTMPIPSFSQEADYATSPHYSKAVVPRAITTVRDWENSIRVASSSMVTCTSLTRASGLADKIEVQYVIYKYSGGIWTSYKSATHSKTRSSLFTDSISLFVDSGYSYYVKTYHRTYSGATVINTETAVSGSIYVN